ncbi:MAG: peptide chain release factor N(5)-glutamine methyltransferase [Bacteroidales bacterium]|jgi:release factor glutamine methyltransferase|nr:peptide chain release factor N(5)-glutamine methyltransferase [Bacteroidales bacterium]MDN5349789.1 release factor glutamine methyltransferase [Bacteroidales bacterium]
MKVPSNNLRVVREYYQNLLEPLYGKQESVQLLLILFKHFFGYDRSQLALQPDLKLSESELLKVHFAVKDLLRHKPIQYITGESEFMGYAFLVKPGVLIPRPETEEMVDMIIKRFQNRSPLSIWDLGTGSGCIAVSLALSLPQAKVKAFDLSEEAISLTKLNAQRLNVDISLQQTDILELRPTERKKIDVIVSNPPYVRQSERHHMQKNVLDFEPDMALFVSDEDPLIFNQAVANIGDKVLAKDGELWLEINEALGKETAALIENTGFKKVQIHQDFSGRDRFVSAVKN